MFSLVYVSSAVSPFSPPELLDLLAQSRENNLKLGVTGMLLYKDGNFMQVLEGEEETVRRLYAKISLDPRHREIITIDDGPLKDREFSSWSMGFRNLDDPEVHSVPGYDNFMNKPLTAEEFVTDPSESRTLLMLFRKNM